MKVIRISKGKTINLSIRLVATLFFVLAIIKVMDILPEPWSILAAMLFSTLLPALWFATNVIIINEDKKTVFDGIWTMGRKFGKPVKYKAIEEVLIEKVKIKQTVFTVSKKQTILANYEYRAYLKLDSGDTYFLLSHPLAERINEKVTKIKKKLEIN